MGTHTPDSWLEPFINTGPDLHDLGELAEMVAKVGDLVNEHISRALSQGNVDGVLMDEVVSDVREVQEKDPLTSTPKNNPSAISAMRLVAEGVGLTHATMVMMADEFEKAWDEAHQEGQQAGDDG